MAMQYRNLNRKSTEDIKAIRQQAGHLREGILAGGKI
jgi:hypothetical protein